jgi:hypothetical protein
MTAKVASAIDAQWQDLMIRAKEKPKKEYRR